MMKLVFWDVQHGHAAYLQTQNQHIVFDLGTGSYGDSGREFSPLLHLKNKYGVRQLDGVVITHPHSDHLYDIGNFDTLAPRVLSRPRHLTDTEVREGNAANDKEYVDGYIAINQRYTGEVPPAADPFKKENNGGVDIQMFTPRNCARTNINNHSIVTVITHAACKIIIPGDNEPPSWNELLEDVAFKTAIKGTHLLLAPHHGRESGFSSTLFETISPFITVVSDGAETDTSAVGRYSQKSRGWKVHKRDGTSEERKCLTTRSDGVITVECDVGSDNKPYMKVVIG